ncbi:MAG: pilus assembly protein PilM [Candidatus Paceibacterota bacterium]
MRFRFRSKDLHNLLVPEFTINAIYIEDRMVRVFCFDKEIDRVIKAKKYALPKGIIEEGILKKPDQLKAFLASLNKKLWPKQKNVWVILALPSANFFTNILNLPDLDKDRFYEAVIFNTQMIAPLSLEEAYFDWEDWGSSNKNGEKEAFIALGIKKQIDPYLNILDETGFNVVAVEPLALSLTRFNNEFIEKQEPVLIIDLRAEGIEFIVAEGRKMIYFDFDSWQEIFGKGVPEKITLELLKKHISREIPMLLNFYSLKRKRIIQKFIFLSFDAKLANVLIQWIHVQYQLSPLEIKLPLYLSRVGRDWFGVIGTALRGIIPRNQDAIVSLAPVGTEQSYEQHHLLRIVSLWSKSIITVLFILVLSLGLIDNMFFRNIENQYRQAIAKPLDPKTIEKEVILKQEVEEFNSLVDRIAQARKYEKNWQEILEEIFNSANSSSINLKRVLVSAGPANNITIQGQSSTKEPIVKFRDALGLSGLFADISLPLSALVETSDGVTFSLNLQI